MNWGHKIVLVYILFISGIVLLVVKSSIQNQDLVTVDYYEQELQYQKRIDETDRANALTTPVTYMIQDNTMFINFPPEMKGKALTVQVLLYCIADKNKDVQKSLSTRDAGLGFAIPPSNRGAHDLKINWTADGTSYYNQFKILIK